MYKVEYWDPELNIWQKVSTHRNLEWAEVNMQVLIQGGKEKARVVLRNKTIAKMEKH